MFKFQCLAVGIVLFGFAFTCPAYASGPTENECYAIVKSGDPLSAVNYCLKEYPGLREPSSSTDSGSSGGGSSTSNEVERNAAIVRSSNGEFYSLQKLTPDAKVPASARLDELEEFDLSKVDKRELNIRGQAIEEFHLPSPD